MSSEMRRAIYVGPVVELRGEGAIVSDASGWSTQGRLTPRKIPAEHVGDALGFPAIVSHGWHEFPAQDFQLCDS